MEEKIQVESLYDELEKIPLEKKKEIKEICDKISSVKPFNSELWKKYFLSWKEKDFMKAKHLRKIIISTTLDSINPQNLTYELENGKNVKICTKNEIIDQIENTIKISHKEIEEIELPKRLYEKTNVEVIEKDCLMAAIELKQQGFNPLILNMANEKTPGGIYFLYQIIFFNFFLIKGSYLGTAGAQEENVMRRSTYSHCLDNKFKVCENKVLYPIEEFSGILSKNVIVFRGEELEGYPFLENPVNVNFIAFPACRRPKLVNKDRMTKEFEIKTTQKIDCLLSIAQKNNFDCLVLSSMGCGSFKNPPLHVIFNEILFWKILKKLAFFNLSFIGCIDF